MRVMNLHDKELEKGLTKIHRIIETRQPIQDLDGKEDRIRPWKQAGRTKYVLTIIVIFIEEMHKWMSLGAWCEQKKLVSFTYRLQS